jgi:glycosyltransferase involved in cell wall biosynthesis
MKTKKYTLSIGIPAYNEESNIQNLLLQLSQQHITSLCLEKVIIYSDGSTDKTKKIASRFRGLPIFVIAGKKRLGKANALNEIIKNISSDVLVILDADVLINDLFTIDHLATRLITDNLDLSAPRVEGLPNKSWISKMLMASLEFKLRLFELINHGNNIYTCHGRARAFSRRIYSRNIFKESINEDAYSYLYCIYHGYQYRYQNDLVIHYQLPRTHRDHALQSIRYFQSKNVSESEFGDEFVSRAYTIPKSLVMKALPLAIYKYPLLIPYIFIAVYLSIKSRFSKRTENTWVVSQSSKSNKQEEII